MRAFSALLCLLTALFIAPGAYAEKRVALVIGNSAYQNTAELRNPRHDAGDIVGTLTRLGFEVVEGRDLDKRAMERLIRQFGVKLSGADLALFFYAGHGLQVGGQNYLVPTDARLASEGDVDFEGLPLMLVLRQMEREAKTSVLLLDACRDNPLARNLARSMGTRSAQVGQGLAEMKTGVGTLIGFSTQPGNIAMDGAGRNSPYAEALLKHIEVPGKDVSALLIAVRNDVLKATEGKQVPWEHTSLTGQVFLNQAGAQVALAAPPPQPPNAPNASISPNYDKEMEIAFWNAVKDSKAPAVLEAYIERYPNGTFAGLARVLVQQLKDQQAAKAPDGPAKVAVLPPSSEPKAPEPQVTDPPALARAIQTELKRVGCDPGRVDGVWGDKAKDALSQFARHAKLTVPAGEPTAAALEAVSIQKGRVCPLVCDSGETEVDGRCIAKAVPERKSVREKAAKAKSARESEREPRREGRREREGETEASKSGMCWADRTHGGGFTLVPCTDPRAGSKAY
jgi:hypothetical protein